MNVVVIDGQSGRMGQLFIERAKAAGLACRLLAVGTNAIATSAMLKAGADAGATGENPGAGRLPHGGCDRGAHRHFVRRFADGGDHARHCRGRWAKQCEKAFAAGEPVQQCGGGNAVSFSFPAH